MAGAIGVAFTPGAFNFAPLAWRRNGKVRVTWQNTELGDGDTIASELTVALASTSRVESELRMHGQSASIFRCKRCLHGIFQIMSVSGLFSGGHIRLGDKNHNHWPNVHALQCAKVPLHCSARMLVK